MPQLIGRVLANHRLNRDFVRRVVTKPCLLIDGTVQRPGEFQREVGCSDRAHDPALALDQDDLTTSEAGGSVRSSGLPHQQQEYTRLRATRSVCSRNLMSRKSTGGSTSRAASIRPDSTAVTSASEVLVGQSGAHDHSVPS